MVATVAGIHLGLDTHANRPAANTAPDGSLYSCSTHGLIYKSNFVGNSWATWGTFGSGMADPMTTRGDVIVRNASNVTDRLATGAAGSVLVGGTDPAWETRTVQTYTPTWTAASVNPALVNGTITGHYQKIADKLYWLNISLLMGSSTTFGTGRWIFSLPFTAKTTSPSHQVIAAQFNDSGTAAFTGSARIAAGATVTDVIVSADATGTFQVAAAVPFTWVSTDRLIITGVVATD